MTHLMLLDFVKKYEPVLGSRSLRQIGFETYDSYREYGAAFFKSKRVFGKKITLLEPLAYYVGRASVGPSSAYHWVRLRWASVGPTDSLRPLFRSPAIFSQTPSKAHIHNRNWGARRCFRKIREQQPSYIMVMPQLSWLVWLVAALLGGQAACTERRPCVTMDPAPPWSDSPLLLSDYQVCKLTTHEIELQGEHLHFDTEVDRIRRVVEANNWRPISESYLHSESRYIYVVSAEGTQFRLNLTTAKQFRNAPVVLQIERRLVALR